MQLCCSNDVVYNRVSHGDSDRNMATVSRELRQHIARQALYRCGYCLTQEQVSGVPLTIEHIHPRSKAGGSTEDNLWLSCRLCNEAKGALIEATDPQTGESAALFHPRQQIWRDHFCWDGASTRIIGISSAGRATVSALSLNTEFRVRARALWVEAGWHPPPDLL